MGHIRSVSEKLSSVQFRDFKSGKPVDVRAVRSGDEIYFMDKHDQLYSSRIIRRENVSFPFTINHKSLIGALVKLKFLTTKEGEDIWSREMKKWNKERISDLEESIAHNQKRLEELKANLNA